MSALTDLSARAAFAVLLERLTTAVEATHAAAARPWEAGEVAARWLEHELAPVLAAYKAKVSNGTVLWACPFCDDGEARWNRGYLPLVVFSCGHQLRVTRDNARRVTLPMTSGDVPVLPGQTIAVTNRPQQGVFRLERVVISGNASSWEVHDIRVGNRSQFNQPGALSGSLFAEDRFEALMDFETVQAAMDIMFIVRYVGPAEAGEVFLAAVVGAPMDVMGPRQQRDLLGAWYNITGRRPPSR